MLLGTPSLYTSDNSGAATPFESSEYKLFIGERKTPIDDALVDAEQTDEKRVNERTSRKNKGDQDNDRKKANTKKSFFGWRTQKKDKDIEADKPAQRPTRLIAPIFNGAGAGLCLCTSLAISYPVSLTIRSQSLYAIAFKCSWLNTCSTRTPSALY
jgi:hypothetical protein